MCCSNNHQTEVLPLKFAMIGYLLSKSVCIIIFVLVKSTVHFSVNVQIAVKSTFSLALPGLPGWLTCGPVQQTHHEENN
jgi:hypothetical protein